VFSNPKWQRAALALNLLGTVILFYSFQATSSDIRLVTAPSAQYPYEKQYAICAENRALVVSSPNGGLMMGLNTCPNWENSRPAAVVNIEHPNFEGLGFVLLITGFVLQYFSVPQAETVEHLRRQLKVAKMKEQNKNSN
jgi:hypothetical protein